MGGILHCWEWQCVPPPSRVMLNHRILIMNDGLDRNVIKVKPPLCFTLDNADSLLHAIDDTLSQLTH